MQLSHRDLVVSSAEMRVRASETNTLKLVRVSRGAHLKISPQWFSIKPWHRRRLAAEARLLAAGLILEGSDPPVFTSESALIILGLDTWWNNPDVTYRRKVSKGGRPTFHQIRIGEGGVPAVNTTQLRSKPTREIDAVNMVGGVFIAPFELIAVDLVRHLHPLQAFYDLSLLVRYLSGFDRFDQERGRLNETEIKAGFASYLESLGTTEKGMRARYLVEVADAGVESPGEAIVVWVLRCILRKDELLVTQQRESGDVGAFYIDVALPAYKVGFEITGMNKFGETERSAHQVAINFVQRQQQLTDSGWTIINVTYEQTKKFGVLVDYLLEKLPKFGVPVHMPNAPLWGAPTPLLTARSRRY